MFQHTRSKTFPRSRSGVHSRRSTGCRPGYTLIELLVTIAIMAVMIAMMLPALQQARRTAAATQCRSQLAQIGEAFHSYHLSQRSLPAGSVDSQSPVVAGPDRYLWGWSLSLLPHLGEQNLAVQLVPSLSVFAPENAAVVAHTPSLLICPGSYPLDPIGYAGCHHDRLAPIATDNNGLLFLNSHVRWDDLVDGSSQSILLGEAANVRWGEGTVGSLRHFGMGYGATWHSVKSGMTPQEAEAKLAEIRVQMQEEQEMIKTFQQGGEGAERDDMENEAEGTEESTLDESSQDEGMGLIGIDEWTPDELTPFDENDPSRPPPPPKSESMELAKVIGFWPAHRDGGHFLMADGSVRIISRTVDINVLRRLANRLDHAEVGDF